MEINPQRPVGASSKTTSKKSLSRTKKAAPVDESEGSIFVGSALQAAIQEGLEALPEVRPDRLDAGRELARDANYPAPEQMDEVGRLAMREFLKDKKGASPRE